MMQDSFHEEIRPSATKLPYTLRSFYNCASNQTLIGNHGNKKCVTLVVRLIWLTLNPPLRVTEIVQRSFDNRIILNHEFENQVVRWGLRALGNAGTLGMA